mmetsp:Transcript_10839/g.31431  ORF Transcript_10839/g.31431 Transcript_10839/m.31431 type:complete len:93 (-) Transcript_10839:86-364(-)
MRGRTKTTTTTTPTSPPPQSPPPVRVPPRSQWPSRPSSSRGGEGGTSSSNGMAVDQNGPHATEVDVQMANQEIEQSFGAPPAAQPAGFAGAS